MLTYLLLGLAVGFRHALEPDHVAAVATLATRGGTLRSRAAQGLFWGLGHTLTLLVVAGLCIAFGVSIPTRWETAFEGLVGLVLLALGASLIPRILDGTIHPPARAHDRAELRSLIVGSIHGLAGSAALVLLVAGSARSPALGVLYVAVFGIGSILGMIALAAAVSVPLGAAARRRAGLHVALCLLAAGTSLVLGADRVWSFAAGLHS